MRLSGWRYTSPGRCVSPARCVPGVLWGGAVALSLGESGHGVERTCGPGEDEHRTEACGRVRRTVRKRYGLRAGIEGTNSEMKRRHGLGRLRVRGGERVRLAIYLKALACNVKRMVGARLIEMDETLVRPAALATAPCAA